jgi:hypothetical protein
MSSEHLTSSQVPMRFAHSQPVLLWFAVRTTFAVACLTSPAGTAEEMTVMTVMTVISDFG